MVVMNSSVPAAGIDLAQVPVRRPAPPSLILACPLPSRHGRSIARETQRPPSKERPGHRAVSLRQLGQQLRQLGEIGGHAPRTQTGRFDGFLLAASPSPRTAPIAGFTMWVRLHAVQMTGS
jgi:hypothetical protein